MDRILILDDDLDFSKKLSEFLINLKFDVDLYHSSKEAIYKINNDNNYSVLVVDYEIDDLDGIEFLEKISSRIKDIPVIFISGHTKLRIAVQAINSGLIFRFLNKPLDTELFQKYIEEAVKFQKSFRAEKILFDTTIKGTIKLLIDIITLQFPLSYNHFPRHRNLSRRIGEKLEYPKLYEIEIASLLCNFGFIGIDKDIVNKESVGKELTYKERLDFKEHPEIAYNLLKNIPNLERIAEGIRYQMLRFDGSNNTTNLDLPKGKQIPILSRILNAVNDFIRITSNGTEDKEALQIMYKSYKKYCPEVYMYLVEEVTGKRDLNVLSKDRKLTVDLSKFMKNNKTLYYKIENIKEGMVLAEDIYDKNEMKIILQGTQFNVYNIHYLNKLIKRGTVKDSMKVYVE